MTIKDESGSSFVEILVAMVILALIVVGLNAGVISLIKNNQNSKELAEASSEGNKLFEDLRRKDYSDIEGDYDVVRGKYYRRWTVSSDSDTVTMSDSYKTVSLTVVWPYYGEFREPYHKIQMSTIISRP